MSAGLQGTTPLTEDELIKAIESGELDPDIIEYYRVLMMSCNADSSPKNIQVVNDSQIIKSGWYDPGLHRSYLIAMIKSSITTRYEVDRTLHFDNDNIPLYTIFLSSRDWINIYVSDYNKIAQEALSELESESISSEYEMHPIPRINYRVKFENSKSE